MKTRIPDPIFQEETNECGLACIVMLAQSQGISVSLDTLRELFPASDHGSSLNDLGNILAQLGIATAPVLFEHSELGEVPLPAILHYGANHYVLLAYRKGRYVCVMNPAIGEQWLPLESLKQEISGYALILDRESPYQTADTLPGALKKKKAPLRAMSMKETAAVRGIYWLMALSFLVGLTLFLMPTMVSNAINQAFSDAAQKEFPYGLFILAFVAATLLALGVRIVTERFVKRFVLVNSGLGFARLMSNSLRFFEKRAPGEIFSRFAAWQAALQQKIELDNGLRSDWIIGAIALGIMFWIAPVLAVISSIGVTVMGLISVWAIFRDRWYTQQIQLKSAALNDFFMETLQGVLTIKTAGLESQRKAQFAWFSRDLFTCLQKQKVYQQVKEGLYQLAGSLEMVVFMLVVLPMVHGKLISLGDFFAYSFLRQIFSSYITRIFYSIIQKSQLHVIDTRAHSLFPEREEDAAALPELPVNHVPHLRFEHIGFYYEPLKPVLQNLTVDLPAGSQIAIVGESGVGKSTLLRLMAGLFSAQEGNCYADGRNINYKPLSQLVYLQSQEDILFNATVMENVTLFDPNFIESKKSHVETMLASLALGPVIASLPGGVNALIRESHAALSLGQRQRLLLARALYSPRPVLVLDEPTANLDDETADIVMTTLQRHCRETGKTLIVVTHSEHILPLFSQVYRLCDGQLRRELRGMEPETSVDMEVVA
ncbi:peptidase domain-containing ABC transporter [Tenebrionicola larvae]|jgi:ABC-type bacteriocin/lantibiotic exporter with double-glycine peptidase domain|uniref:ATP-binding cassette domain-containing protein n=1 Tax=Tenebrionicola larvae TaxID=2815733 RepID=A0A949Q5L7_9ENTR|nr:ATP-binding cassette domain-containing protein [Tenebrionicola larvae]MBV5096251.1 ATP-binding cassette domain-containing protein [Tenebrionicola larvae]